jgi:polar amino acid transport system substrate-binding protein
MKRAIFILSFMMTLYGWCDMPKRIHLVEDPWPPYTFGELSSEPQKGAVVEALAYIFKNTELKLTLYPWKRALAMAKEGVVDGLMLTLETGERKEDFVFSAPLFYDEIVFITRADTKLRYEGLHSLQGITIATVHGSKYSDEFQEAILNKRIQVEPADELQTNIKKLMNKRIDVMIASKIAFCGALKDLNTDLHYKALSPALKKIELKIAISKHSPFAGQIESINQDIARLKKDTSYKEIMQRYFLICHF